MVLLLLLWGCVHLAVSSAGCNGRCNSLSDPTALVAICTILGGETAMSVYFSINYTQLRIIVVIVCSTLFYYCCTRYGLLICWVAHRLYYAAFCPRFRRV